MLTNCVFLVNILPHLTSTPKDVDFNCTVQIYDFRMLIFCIFAYQYKNHKSFAEMSFIQTILHRFEVYPSLHLHRVICCEEVKPGYMCITVYFGHVDNIIFYCKDFYFHIISREDKNKHFLCSCDWNK